MEIFHKIYLRLFSVSFLSFRSLLHFMKSKFGVTSSFLIKLSFSQNQIFNKMKNSYVSFFLVSGLAPFVADITFIVILLSQIYVCTTSYQLFNVPCRTWCHQPKGQHIFKTYVINVTELIFKFSLCQIRFKLGKLTNSNECSSVSPNTTYLTSERNFTRVPKLTSLKLSWINHNYHFFKEVSTYISFARDSF